MPIDLVLHTPGGLVLAAMQIARAVEAHKAKVTVYVPVYAMSGGTLIALAANEIVRCSVRSIRRSLDFRLRASSKPATRSPSEMSSTSRWFSPIWERRLSRKLNEVL